MLEKIKSNQAIQGSFVFMCAGLFYLYMYVLRVSPSVITDDLMTLFDLSVTELGVFISLYYVGYLPLQIPCGYVLDRLGLRTVITASAALCAIGTFVFAMADVLWAAQIGRLLMGVGSACAYIACMKVGVEWFEPKTFPLITSLTLMVGMLGAMFGTQPFAKLVESVGVYDAMLILGYIGVGITALSFLIIRDRPRTQKQIKREEKETPSIFKSLKIVMLDKRNWLLGMYGCFMYAAISGFAELWSVTYLIKQYGISKMQAATLTSAFFIGIALGGPIVVKIIEKFFTRENGMMAIGFLGAALFAILLFFEFENLWIVGALLFSQGAICGGHVLCFVIAQNNTNILLSGTVLGLINTLIMTSGMIFQPLIGYILEYNWNGLMHNGLPLFTVQNFQMALSTVFISYILASLCMIILKRMPPSNVVGE